MMSNDVFDAFSDLGERCEMCEQRFGMGRHPAMRNGPGAWLCRECADSLYSEIEQIEAQKHAQRKCADCGSLDVALISQKPRFDLEWTPEVCFCGPCLDLRFSRWPRS